VKKKKKKRREEKRKKETKERERKKVNGKEEGPTHRSIHIYFFNSMFLVCYVFL